MAAMRTIAGAIHGSGASAASSRLPRPTPDAGAVAPASGVLVLPSSTSAVLQRGLLDVAQDLLRVAVRDGGAEVVLDRTGHRGPRRVAGRRELRGRQRV